MYVLPSMSSMTEFSAFLKTRGDVFVALTMNSSSFATAFFASGPGGSTLMFGTFAMVLCSVEEP